MSINQDIIEITKIYFNQIDEYLYESNKDHIKDLVPMFYSPNIDDICCNVSDHILFIGINPSMSKLEYNKIKNKELLACFSFNNFLKSENQQSIINELVSFQHQLIHGTEEKIMYFKVLSKEILEPFKIGDKFDHYDLFSLRSTSQNNVITILKYLKKSGGDNYDNYFDKSINRFRQKILIKKFKAIVCLNAEVSKQLHHILELENAPQICNVKFANKKLGYFKSSNQNWPPFLLFKQLYGKHTQGKNKAKFDEEFNCFKELLFQVLNVSPDQLHMLNHLPSNFGAKAVQFG